jgi:transposase InsO family protein
LRLTGLRRAVADLARPAGRSVNLAQLISRFCAAVTRFQCNSSDSFGLYKAALIKKNGPWKTQPDVELATAGYVGWYNTRRLHTAIGGIPPS